MRIKILEGKDPNKTNVVDFISGNAALRILPYGDKWEYIPGTIDKMSFSFWVIRVVLSKTVAKLQATEK